MNDTEEEVCDLVFLLSMRVVESIDVYVNVFADDIYEHV